MVVSPLFLQWQGRGIRRIKLLKKIDWDKSNRLASNQYFTNASPLQAN